MTQMFPQPPSSIPRLCCFCTRLALSFCGFLAFFCEICEYVRVAEWCLEVMCAQVVAAMDANHQITAKSIKAVCPLPLARIALAFKFHGYFAGTKTNFWFLRIELSLLVLVSTQIP